MSSIIPLEFGPESTIPTGIGIILYTILILIVFTFWFWMLIDCLRMPMDKFYEYSEHGKLVWFLVIIFFHIAGALLYYFFISNKNV